MIKKLRVKFTIAAVAVVFLVLLVVLGIINIMNYQKILSDADEILEVISSHQGEFPEKLPPPHLQEKVRMSPEFPYELRYFSVELQKDGEVISSDVGKIAAVDTETAETYAKKIMRKEKSSGFIQSYRYLRIDTEQDTVRITFLDCTRDLNTFETFLVTSVCVAVLGMISVFMIMLLVSKKIVRPFAESYEKQKRFITDAGHEIKTPLTIIDADAAVLEMETGENEWLSDIQKQTLRLKELTNDLIYLSRMEEGQNVIPMLDFPISEVALETAESFLTMAKAKDKIFQYQIQPMVSYYGNPKDIQRLFSILLDNAVKYSDPGGRINFSLEKKGKNIVIYVYNTAESVNGENLDCLFDRFYRADQSRNSETGGHGIGLSIAKAVAQSHKSRIFASSQDGKSLLITVILNCRLKSG